MLVQAATITIAPLDYYSSLTALPVSALLRLDLISGDTIAAHPLKRQGRSCRLYVKSSTSSSAHCNKPKPLQQPAGPGALQELISALLPAHFIHATLVLQVPRRWETCLGFETSTCWPLLPQDSHMTPFTFPRPSSQVTTGRPFLTILLKTSTSSQFLTSLLCFIFPQITTHTYTHDLSHPARIWIFGLFCWPQYPQKWK